MGKAEKLEQFCERKLMEIGFRQLKGMYRYEANFIELGKVYAGFEACKISRKVYISIFMRFENPDKAKELGFNDTHLNEYSGKYNFHSLDCTQHINWALSRFENLTIDNSDRFIKREKLDSDYDININIDIKHNLVSFQFIYDGAKIISYTNLKECINLKLCEVLEIHKNKTPKSSDMEVIK